MTFRLSDEQLEIRALAREFVLGEIRPHSPAWDEDRALAPTIFESLGQLGFMGMRIPETYGGLELDVPTYALVLQELGWGDASVALAVAIHSGPVTSLLLRHGTPDQKSRYLPAMATGEVLGAFALSEPEAGSDAQALRTTYRSEGEGWVLDGTKKWVTNGSLAGLVLLFARQRDGDGISAFLVEPNTPGYRVGKRETTMGLAASETVEVELDGVRLERGALLGEEGNGFHYAMEALEIGRLGVAALAVGIGRAALEHARDYSLERTQFGRPLSSFQATQFKLAEMASRLAGAQALVAMGGEAMEGSADPEGPTAGALAAMAKLAASEAAVWTADEAVQIFGGYGYMRDYPVERLLRDAKGTEIFEGTSEIMRLVVAREILKGPGV